MSYLGWHDVFRSISFSCLSNLLLSRITPGRHTNQKAPGPRKLSSNVTHIFYCYLPSSHLLFLLKRRTTTLYAIRHLSIQVDTQLTKSRRCSRGRPLHSQTLSRRTWCDDRKDFWDSELDCSFIVRFFFFLICLQF
jgi:hypothetical protein